MSIVYTSINNEFMTKVSQIIIMSINNICSQSEILIIWTSIALNLKANINTESY